MPVSPIRLRQAVVAAQDLDAVAGRLRSELALGEPYADPGVGYFGLRNAVFALGDTFLEVISPTQPDTAAGRLLERRGSDTGYMLMFQVEDLEAARGRAGELGIREVFEVSLDDIDEVHLHPADMRGAIVSLSQPKPPAAWRWGGDGWAERAAGLSVAGAVVGVREPDAVAERWSAVLGAPAAQAGISFAPDADERGVVEVLLSGSSPPSRQPLRAGGVSFRFNHEEER